MAVKHRPEQSITLCLTGDLALRDVELSGLAGRGTSKVTPTMERRDGALQSQEDLRLDPVRHHPGGSPGWFTQGPGIGMRLQDPPDHPGGCVGKQNSKEDP
ncbi:hypothetical protein PCANC_22996 [Puccinia coronata f. sp. avenae]|uniref:Uncharacterized protein n=1 Tax=Puccinia coronata f. sp. avenae TaxID=200324 RepID=A0A2N5U5S1_9BASI|nr:hypothetical protein PCANC_22996 [Puccinia coronata f. sp. avenae]PLW48870.1 hypothetical protein PCASD_02751 [Puccinia coronata f. sp. avenae]